MMPIKLPPEAIRRAINNTPQRRSIWREIEDVTAGSILLGVLFAILIISLLSSNTI